mmetsp:Transcript_940/g.1998  ORF Transcript_940/g.1998 Transcript_940/m.1998 type:complete len:119 (+) Transcript_940:313-669(+)
MTKNFVYDHKIQKRHKSGDLILNRQNLERQHELRPNINTIRNDNTTVVPSIDSVWNDNTTVIPWQIWHDTKMVVPYKHSTRHHNDRHNKSLDVSLSPFRVNQTQEFFSSKFGYSIVGG